MLIFAFSLMCYVDNVGHTYYSTMHDVRNVCRVSALFSNVCCTFYDNQPTIPCLTHTYTHTHARAHTYILPKFSFNNNYYYNYNFFNNNIYCFFLSLLPLLQFANMLNTSIIYYIFKHIQVDDFT